MTNTEIFDALMEAYAVTAEEVAEIAGKHENLAMATLKSHSLGFLYRMLDILQPDPELSAYPDNIRQR